LEPSYADILQVRNPVHRSDIYGPILPENFFAPLTLVDLKELWRTHFRVEVLAEELR